MRLKPPIRYFGSKDSLAEEILKIFPPHRRYVEPFAGSASVFFQKPRAVEEFLNDLDPAIVNFLRALQQDPEELEALLWATPFNLDYEEDAELEGTAAAAAFCARQVMSFNGHHSGSNGLDRGKSHSSKATTLANWYSRIRPASARLQGVKITQNDATDVITKHMYETSTLLYCDPPYLGHSKDYREKVQYQRMVRLLHSCRCRVVLSEGPDAIVHFPKWRCKEMPVFQRSNKTNGTECLFWNF